MGNAWKAAATAVAIGALLVGCSSGGGEAAPATTAASPSANLAAATASKQIGSQLTSMIQGEARETCKVLKGAPVNRQPAEYRARTLKMNVAVAMAPSSGQAKDVNVWATDQQIHAYCPEFESLTSYPPAWEAEQ